MQILRLREVAYMDETLGPDPGWRNRDESVHTLRADRSEMKEEAAQCLLPASPIR